MKSAWAILSVASSIILLFFLSIYSLTDDSDIREIMFYFIFLTILSFLLIAIVLRFRSAKGIR